MSATINDLKFVIFGSGHDYTLMNSGTGEGQRFFSHPYMPLNSVNYRNQYYFLVPDENGNLFDAVKDDYSHCTFTPAIGSSFDTEGEVEVKVHYYREYIHDEETIIVDRTLSQKIEVVDHGTVTTTWGSKYTVYNDGYCFIHPSSTSFCGDDSFYRSWRDSSIRIQKISSLPWRTTALGFHSGNYYGGLMTNCYSLETIPWWDEEEQYWRDIDKPIDITELQYADVSNVTTMESLLEYGSPITGFEALADWDVSKVTVFDNAFYYASGGEEYDGLSDFTFLSKWNTSSAISMKDMFRYLNVKSSHGLENLNVSNANISGMFRECLWLKDIVALANWNVSNATDFSYLFYYCSELESLHGIENWDVSKVTSFSQIFLGCETIEDVDVLANWDVSKVSNFSYAFSGCQKLTDISALANWDVSSSTDISNMFDSCVALEDISPLADWDVSNVTTLDGTFRYTGISSLEPLADWDVSHVTIMTSTFRHCSNLHSLDGLEDWDVSHVTNFGASGTYSSSQGTFGSLRLADISAIANWDTSSAVSFRYMFDVCAWLFDLSPLANWDMSHGEIKFMFNDDNVYYSSLLGKRVYYHGVYGDTYYEDYQGNRYISGVYDSDHPLQLIDKNASSAQSWNVGSGSGKGAFPSNWINRPSWN